LPASPRLQRNAVCLVHVYARVEHAFELARRLGADRDGDAVAVAFRRLVRERRQRLRTFLTALLRARQG